MVRKDALWKGIIETLARDFIAFFYPALYDRMDKRRDPDFLDKELAALQQPSASRMRHADKLVKVHLNGGGEQWMLIHVEVQGYKDEDFAQRMFQYFYRIYDKYGKAPLGLAIYTDRHVHLHQRQFIHELFDTKVTYSFKIFSIISHSPEDLRQSGNIFGLILEIARRALDDYEDDSAIIQTKMEMIRYYFSQGLEKETFRSIMDFIRMYLRFQNQSSNRIFEQQLQELHLNQESMGIREAILKDAEEQGMEKGVNQGLKRGITLEKQKVILRARNKGFEISEIADLVDLPEEEVLKILQAHDSPPSR
jgi:predicted transposase/invertase (TIGR01784 family)